MESTGSGDERKKNKADIFGGTSYNCLFFVIVNHTASGEMMAKQLETKFWFIFTTYFFCSKIAVPVFLMIAGANLLGKVDDYRKHIKRVIRILLVGILFLFVYYLRYIAANQEAVKFIDFFKMIYHNNITNAFWYLYMYLGLLIMMPLLQRMSVHMKKNDYLYLLFWIMIFMGIMPIIIHYFPDYSYCEHFNSAILPVYIGMVFTGYYVSHEVELEWKYFLWSIVIICNRFVYYSFA